MNSSCHNIDVHKYVHILSCSSHKSNTSTKTFNRTLLFFIDCIYRIAGNFSKIDTLTISLVDMKTQKFSPQESGSNNNIVRATSSANWNDGESMNREN